MQGGTVARILNLSPSATIIGAIVLSFFFFRITDMFVGTVYYYLFSDVVPASLLSRFMALFRVVSALSTMFYSAFIFKFSETHMRHIFIGAAIVYMVGYTLMCLNVKEGKYPPPPAGMKRKSVFEVILVYFRECFFHRFYWYFFLSNALWGLAGAAGGFSLFLSNKELGLTLDQIGKIAAASQGVNVALLYFAGMLADRLHPLRFMLWTVILQSIWAFTGLIWLFWDPTPHQALIATIILTVVAVPLGVMHTAASFPMIVRLLPKDRFGQFAAANAMVISIIGMFSGAVAGAFLDVMVNIHKAKHGPNFGYRYIGVWNVFFVWIAAWMLFALHREWKKRGGQENFTPPSPDDPNDGGGDRGFDVIVKGPAPASALSVDNEEAK